MALATFDHFVVAGATLDAACEAVETALGVSLQAGGQHARMGTHNRLLGLGPADYLEAIAIDPDAPPPGRARWFNLDRFEGAPRPVAWVMRVDDLDAAVAQLPEGMGEILQFERGDLRWRMVVPTDGLLPFDGLFPGFIEWQVDEIPPARLEDRGCRLKALEVMHPQGIDIAVALAPFLGDARLHIVGGPQMGLRAIIETPEGERVIE
ncbi:MAG: VOC family protein [Rhodobacteraceae bacterium]|nr:VOC family protein [Paracoccaceae bacterium]